MPGPWQKRGAVFLLLCLLSLGVGPASAFWRVEGLGPQTKVEEKLTRIARQILAESERAISGRADKADEKVLRLYEKGQQLWADSPANRPGQMTLAGKETPYEAGIIVEAIVAYYDATGRPGLALPYLEDAAREVRELLQFRTWIEINKALMERQRALGMLDRQRQVFDDTMAFYRRLGVANAGADDEPSVDSVAYLRWLGFSAGQGDLVSDAELIRHFDHFLKSTRTGIRYWPWSPDVGFTFMRDFPQYLAALAREKDPRLPQAIGAYLEAVKWNRNADPLQVAEAAGTNYYFHPLGRSMFEEFSARLGETDPWTIRKNKVTPPTSEQERFRIAAPYYRELTLAHIAWLQGNAEASLQRTARAEQAFEAVEQAYASYRTELLAADGLTDSLQAMRLLRARALEATGEYRLARDLYASHIDWSEKARSSLSVDERVHFFRGKALPAYLGQIRSLARITKAAPGDAATNELLAAIDQVKGRQLLELMNIDAGPDPVSVQTIRQTLPAGGGLLLFQDLEDALLVLAITPALTDLQLLPKPANWNNSIFALRNALATGATLERQSLQSISDSLLGFVADELQQLDTVYVLNDGALASLPASILALPSGELLGELTPIVYLPSLASLTSGAARGRATQGRQLLAVADPVYVDHSAPTRRISEEDIALRGTSLLGYFQPLPETREEVETIAGVFEGGATLLLGEKATESRIRQLALGDYSHLHLATHGVIGDELPGLFEPALVLSQEADEDGLLTASEVAQLELNAELAVLSACNTGNGEYFNGEGLVGMGRAFMAAGTRNVIVSLWPVESYSTKLLMERLYAHLASGLGVSNALFQAQQDLRNASGDAMAAGDRGITIERSNQEDSGASTEHPYDNPFFWSPFVLISAG